MAGSYLLDSTAGMLTLPSNTTVLSTNVFFNSSQPASVSHCVKDWILIHQLLFKLWLFPFSDSLTCPVCVTHAAMSCPQSPVPSLAFAENGLVLVLCLVYTRSETIFLHLLFLARFHPHGPQLSSLGYWWTQLLSPCGQSYTLGEPILHSYKIIISRSCALKPYTPWLNITEMVKPAKQR